MKRAQRQLRDELICASVLSPAVLRLLEAARRLGSGPLSALSKGDWEILEIAAEAAPKVRQ